MIIPAHKVIAILIAVLSFPLGAAAQSADAPVMSLRLSSDRVLLGEPVWVLVTAENRGNALIERNPGDECFLFHNLPVTAEVPEASPGTGKPRPCTYGRAGNCLTEGNTAELKPGGTATWRYLLKGNFHFTHAGLYYLTLTSHPGRPFQPGARTPSSAPTPITQTMTLQVIARDDAALLAREKQLAADVEAQILTTPTEPGADRALLFRERTNLRAIRSGLATQPTPGMEPVFEHWLQLPN